MAALHAARGNHQVHGAALIRAFLTLNHIMELISLPLSPSIVIMLPQIHTPTPRPRENDEQRRDVDSKYGPMRGPPLPPMVTAASTRCHVERRSPLELHQSRMIKAPDERPVGLPCMGLLVKHTAVVHHTIMEHQQLDSLAGLAS